MNRFQIATILLLATGLLPAPAAAAAEPRFGVAAGLIDVTRSRETFEAGLEFYFREFSAWRLRPQVGVAATLDGAYYGFGGLRRPFRLARWTLEPSFSISLYEEGDGKDLGGPLEFRSGLDVLFERGHGVRVGFGFYHLSHARIYGDNPGTNSLHFRVLFP